MPLYRAIFLAAACALALSSCSEPIDDPTCSRNSDCAAGHLCDPDGNCIRSEPITIEPGTLPDALVGDGSYSQTIVPRGGIQPYS